jgi:hypothetical protein
VIQAEKVIVLKKTDIGHIAQEIPPEIRSCFAGDASAHCEHQEVPHFVIYNLWNSLKDNEMQ